MPMGLVYPYCLLSELVCTLGETGEMPTNVLSRSDDVKMTKLKSEKRELANSDVVNVVSCNSIFSNSPL